MMKQILPLLFLSVMSLVAAPSINLTGKWDCALDEKDRMLAVPPNEWVWNDTMVLPGTTDLAHKGPHVTRSIPFHYHLNREYAYLGPAYYSRTIHIPKNWQGKSVELFLERVMWQSRVWLDGKEVSAPQDSLNTPHIHHLGKLAPGVHQLTIRVDNRMIHPIGDKGHAYGDQTQSIWNGIVGKIELRAQAAEHLGLVRVFPSNDGHVKVEVNGHFASGLKLNTVCLDPEKPSPGSAQPFATAVSKAEGAATVMLRGKIGFKPQLWSEFSPKLYHLKVSLKRGEEVIDTRTVTFGFRSVTRDGNRLLINGTPAFMRGNLECAVFSRTGHPPVTVEAWRKIWQVYKDHHLNHARFHSWCPPEAAFTAADEMGIYLQVEAPIWIDHWMTKPNPRKEMDTLGYPKGLGKGDRTIDAFALAEIRRTIDTYGNHPSFVFFAIGNELGTSNFKVTGTWMRDAKKHDPRHLYAASTARAITPFCDYNATHNIPGIGWTRQKVTFGTNWDYEKIYGKASVPIIAHEIGQWPVYVDWKKELPKYSGPLKPYRLLEMAEEAKKNGLYDRSEELKMASGATNRILYRDEIESFLRTPSCRGFQLLGMQDFSGQGEALVGWLDSFYESKGTTDAVDFRRYCAPSVPLLKLPGYVFRSHDKSEVEALFHHYGSKPIQGVTATWKLTSSDGVLVDQGKLPRFDAPVGSVKSLGTFIPDFSSVQTAAQMKLSIEIPSLHLKNHYDIWIYPELKSVEKTDVKITSDWEGEARPALAKGQTVLLIANHLGGPATSKLAHWFPLYWSVPFFPGQNRETIGLCVAQGHSVFRHFPTPPHGDWNWFRLCRGARGFDLTQITPNHYRAMAEPVSDFHYNRRLASIFEVKVGKGKLLVCGYNITKEQSQQFPEVAQLRHSLVEYVHSKEFDPKTYLEFGVLDKLFHDPTIQLKKLPPRFAKADLYVNAAGKLGPQRQSLPWVKRRDQIVHRVKGVDYVVQADGTWRDQYGSAWHGKNMTITITPRSGVPGKLFVRFHDWNKNSRTGTLTFEGKSRRLGPHTDGVWVEFPVIREDSNDARLVLQSEALTGPNLMITDMVFVPDE